MYVPIACFLASVNLSINTKQSMLHYVEMQYMLIHKCTYRTTVWIHSDHLDVFLYGCCFETCTYSCRHGVTLAWRDIGQGLVM